MLVNKLFYDNLYTYVKIFNRKKYTYVKIFNRKKYTYNNILKMEKQERSFRDPSCVSLVELAVVPGEVHRRAGSEAVLAEDALILVDPDLSVLHVQRLGLAPRRA